MPQTIVVLGSDGYTGWPLVCHLLDQGHDVVGLDNHSRRDRAAPSTTPILGGERLAAAEEVFDGEFTFYKADITSRQVLPELVKNMWPDTVVNLAQIPSAPFSMQSREAAWTTQENNIKGSLNLYWALHEADSNAHVVQLATMGEYPVGDDIPEGFLEDGRPAPKDPGSFYHASKVNTTVNTHFAAKTWDIPTTEIYQGIVYGVSMFEERDDRLITRFDVDDVWGTVLNRFTAQAAVGHPLTVYGEGGQKRAMLSLPDCIQCLSLAIENPPQPGSGRYPYRAVNQFDGAHRVKELAAMVAEHTGAEIHHITNPRVEDDSEHVYDPEREVLDELGYEPTRSLEAEFERTYEIISRPEIVDRIDGQEIAPTVAWR